jgi:hypothetical protein
MSSPEATVDTFDPSTPFPFDLHGWDGTEWSGSEIRVEADGWDGRYHAYAYTTALLKLPGVSIGRSWTFIVVDLAAPRLVVNTRVKTRDQALTLLSTYLAEHPAESL